MAELQRGFGYTKEDLNMILKPMAVHRQGRGVVDGRRYAAGVFGASAPRPLYHVFPAAGLRR